MASKIAIKKIKRENFGFVFRIIEVIVEYEAKLTWVRGVTLPSHYFNALTFNAQTPKMDINSWTPTLYNITLQ